jgi:hypothetical protein
LRRSKRYKTQMCRRIVANEQCPFGLDCKYAHTHEELQTLGSIQNELPKHQCIPIQPLKMVLHFLECHPQTHEQRIVTWEFPLLGQAHVVIH